MKDGVIGAEHDGVGEALFDELEAENAVIDIFEFRAVKVDHIDFNTRGAKIVGKGFNEGARVMTVNESAVDEIDTDNA